VPEYVVLFVLLCNDEESIDGLIVFMHPPTCIDKGRNMHSGGDVGDVVLSVCDFVCDNPRITGTAEARDFKFV